MCVVPYSRGARTGILGYGLCGDDSSWFAPPPLHISVSIIWLNRFPSPSSWFWTLRKVFWHDTGGTSGQLEATASRNLHHFLYLFLITLSIQSCASCFLCKVTIVIDRETACKWGYWWHRDYPHKFYSCRVLASSGCPCPCTQSRPSNLCHITIASAMHCPPLFYPTLPSSTFLLSRYPGLQAPSDPMSALSCFH